MARLKPILLLIFLVSATVCATRVAFDDDEFQHAHMAYLLARGQVPHRDFFEHHLPLYHFLIAPLTLGSPEPGRLLWLRGLQVLLAGVTLILLDRALKQRNRQAPAGVLVLVACSPIFFLKMIELRPEGLSVMLGIASLLLLGPWKPRSLLAGLLAGAMVVVSQKFVFLAAGLFLLCGLEQRGRGLIRFAIGGSLLPLGCGLYFLLAGAGHEAFARLVVLNFSWRERFSPAMYGSALWSDSALLLVLGGIGILSEGPSKPRRAAAVLLGAGIAAVLLIPIPFRQSFLMLYPGLALGAGLGWRMLTRLTPPGSARTGFAVLLTLAGTLPGLNTLRQALRETLTEDLSLMRRLHARSPRPIYDGRGLMVFRPHVGYHAWMHDGLRLMLDPETLAEETIQALRTADFPDVLMDYRVRQMPEALLTFLHTHYLPGQPVPLWVPGVRVDRARLIAGESEIQLPGSGNWRADWRGGEIFLNGQPISPGSILTPAAGPLRIRGRGFIRDFEIRRLESSP